MRPFDQNLGIKCLKGWYDRREHSLRIVWWRRESVSQGVFTSTFYSWSNNVDFKFGFQRPPHVLEGLPSLEFNFTYEELPLWTSPNFTHIQLLHNVLQHLPRWGWPGQHHIKHKSDLISICMTVKRCERWYKKKKAADHILYRILRWLGWRTPTKCERRWKQ